MDMERLIEEVRKYPVLYDQTNPKYRNSEYKERVWKKITEVLEARGGIKECKKKWSSIRDQLRRTIQKRKTVSGQAAIRQHKYKYEDLLKFLVPYIAERETLSNVSYSQEDIETEEQEFTVDTQVQESTNEEDSAIYIDMDEEPAITESQEIQRKNMSNSTQHSQTPSASSSAISVKKDKFVKPTLKRKIQRGIKQQESASSQLMAFILAEKEEEKQAKRSPALMAEQNAVDAFLTGITPPLKSLDPILFNQAKGKIFAIVQEFEMQQLMKNQGQYIDHRSQADVPPFSPTSSSRSVTTPFPSPTKNDNLNFPESRSYQVENSGQT